MDEIMESVNEDDGTMSLSGPSEQENVQEAYNKMGTMQQREIFHQKIRDSYYGKITTNEKMPAQPLDMETSLEYLPVTTETAENSKAEKKPNWISNEDKQRLQKNWKCSKLLRRCFEEKNSPETFGWFVRCSRQ